MAAPNHNNKNLQSTELDGLYGYINYLRNSIAQTSQQIRKQEKSARQLIFNLASHFGISSMQSRDKIAQNMIENGVVFLDSELSGYKNFKQKEKQKQKNREKQRRRKIRFEEQMEKFNKNHKKVKLTLSSNQNDKNQQ